MIFIPDVFVIGAMKAGTTTLYRLLSSHPDVCVTKSKEVNYFLNVKSIVELNELYKIQFESPGLTKVDVSPSYSRLHRWPGVAERICAANPLAKIIFLARDPLDRLLSHLHHDLLRDRIKVSQLEPIVLANSDYMLTSSYFFQLAPYLKLFKKENIFVLSYEDLAHHPEEVASGLFKFLNIKPIELKVEKSFSSDSRYLIKYHDLIHSLFGNGRISKTYHYLWYLLSIKIGRPTLDSVVVEKIKNRLLIDYNLFESEFDFKNVKSHLKNRF